MSHRFTAIRAAWAGSTILAAAAFGLAAPAAAQEGETATEADGQLATIIVTANRREENLQDVPLAVTALDANTLARNDVRVALVEPEEVAPHRGIEIPGFDVVGQRQPREGAGLREGLEAARRAPGHGAPEAAPAGAQPTPEGRGGTRRLSKADAPTPAGDSTGKARSR